VEKPGRESVLDGIPQGMPALALAAKLVGRAEKVGLEPVATDAVPARVAELGDVLLATVVAARAAGLDAERALRDALRRLQSDIRGAENAAAG
jgi:XTP/dITP diphosphohydrolase